MAFLMYHRTENVDNRINCILEGKVFQMITLEILSEDKISGWSISRMS